LSFTEPILDIEINKKAGIYKLNNGSWICDTNGAEPKYKK